MNLDKRSKVLLGILVFVAVLFLWPEGSSRRSSTGGSDTASGSVFKVRGQGRRREAEPVKDVVTLDFGRLDPRAEYAQQSRNPFEYYVKPTITPKDKFQDEIKPLVITKVKEDPVADQPPPGPVLPTTDHIQYLGNFGSKRVKIAVIRIDDVEQNVVQGDTFDQDFVLQSIGYESVDIGFLNFPDQPPERLAINSE